MTSEKVLDSCALVFLKTVLYLYGPKSNVPSSSDAIGGIYLMKITVSSIYTLLVDVSTVVLWDLSRFFLLPHILA